MNESGIILAPKDKMWRKRHSLCLPGLDRLAEMVDMEKVSTCSGSNVERKGKGEKASVRIRELYKKQRDNFKVEEWDARQSFPSKNIQSRHA